MSQVELFPSGDFCSHGHREKYSPVSGLTQIFRPWTNRAMSGRCVSHHSASSDVADNPPLPAVSQHLPHELQFFMSGSPASATALLHGSAIEYHLIGTRRTCRAIVFFGVLINNFANVDAGGQKQRR